MQSIDSRKEYQQKLKIRTAINSSKILCN